MKTTFLGLGSNLGDREKNLLRAISLIEKRFTIIDYSSLYNTSPVGYKDQRDFLNMVIKTDSEQVAPFELLNFLKSIEKEMGRKKTFRFGPRLIDIDILYKEGVHIESDVISIPHKELFKRNFVLIPLSELTEYLIVDSEKLILKDFIKKDIANKVILYKHKEEIKLNG